MLARVQKTKCKRGHLLTGDNLRIEWLDNDGLRKQRVCVTCRNLRQRKSRIVYVEKRILVESPGEPALREKIADLEERVLQLRAMLIAPCYQFDSLKLTKKEREIVTTFYNGAGRVFTRSTMGELLFENVTWKSLDVFLARIRRKLPAGVAITTVRGVGWTMSREHAGLLKPFE